MHIYADMGVCAQARLIVFQPMEEIEENCNAAYPKEKLSEGLT